MKAVALCVGLGLLGCRPSVDTAPPVPAPLPVCPEPSPQPEPLEADAKLFFAAVDELLSGGSTPSYDQLKAEFPDSPHTARVKALGTRIASLTGKLNAANKELQQRRNDEAGCTTNLEQLTRERDRLRQDLDQLKRVMLEAELRPR